MKGLDRHRKEVDRIDDQILALLTKRAKVVQAIGRLKKTRQAGLHSPARELEIYERLTTQNTGPLPNEAVRAVFREIISASLSLEGPLKVAYLGPKATFTHMACLQQFGDSATYIPVDSIGEVFSEVERGRAEYGVVPIENSTEGIVSHTLDVFVDSPLKITGEVLQEVSHHLMSKSGRIEDNIHNFTRFLVVSRTSPERTGRDKTSVMFSVKDRTGALYDLLRPFAMRGINLTKIESRPSRRKAWEYLFFVDVEGHVADERVKQTLEEVKRQCLFLKILGSYPSGT